MLFLYLPCFFYFDIFYYFILIIFACIHALYIKLFSQEEEVGLPEGLSPLLYLKSPVSLPWSLELVGSIKKSFPLQKQSSNVSSKNLVHKRT